MEIKVEQLGNMSTLTLGGEVNAFNSRDLVAKIADLVEQGQYHIAVCLDDVSYVDSSGLGALVAGLKKVKGHNGNLILINPQPDVREALRMTRLDTIFPMYDNIKDLAEAVLS